MCCPESGDVCILVCLLIWVTYFLLVENNAMCCFPPTIIGLHGNPYYLIIVTH